jgi:opine dehydrogenase
MRLSILGAGAIGTAAAALAAARGHTVTLWSPRGGGTAGIINSVAVDGALVGRFPVKVAADLGRAAAEADCLLLAVPGHAQPGVMRRLAAVVQGTPVVLVSPATALSPLLLEQLLAARGLRLAIGALATPPLLAERLGPDQVRLLRVRGQVALAALPHSALGPIAPLLPTLFGVPAAGLPDPLSAALFDLMPLVQAAQALGGANGAEPQAVMRLVLALAAERDRLATACGHRMPDAGRFFAELGGLPKAEPARALAEAPHALTFLLALGAAAGVAVPVAEAALTLLEVLGGQELRRHAVLEGLAPGTLERLVPRR